MPIEVGDSSLIVRSKINQVLTNAGLDSAGNVDTTTATTLLNEAAELWDVDVEFVDRMPEADFRADFATLEEVVWSPLSLFVGGTTKGAWYDPSDLTSMFQNSNGTTAVEVGDPVGYIADKSGNGYHAVQATSGARPVLRQDAQGRYYLETDGTDDVLVASFTAVSTARAMMVVAAQVDSTGPSSADEAFSCGYSGDSNPMMFVRRFVDPRVIGGWRSLAGVDVGADWIAAAGSDGRHVFTTLASDANVALRLDAVQKAVGSGVPASATFDRIGIMALVRSTTSNWAPGRFYGGVIVFRAVSASELSETENYMVELGLNP